MFATAVAAPDALWIDHSSHELANGRRGAVIFTGVTSFDTAVLNAARSNSLTVQWVPANNIAPGSTPEEIGQQLAGQVNFFLMIEYKCLPEIHEQFAAVHKSYTAHEWTEVDYQQNSHTGMPQGHHTWITDERRYTDYVDIPASSFNEGDVYLCFKIYDLSGKMIAVYNRRFNYESYEASFAHGAEYFFSGALKNIINNTNDSFENEKVSAQEWSAAGYDFKGKSLIYMAPVTTSADEIADLPTFAMTFGESAMTEAAKRLHGIMVTYNEAAPLRMEIDVSNFFGSYRRVEPDYDLTEQTDRSYDSYQHDDDIFQDDIVTTRHWVECDTSQGTCKLDFCVTVSIKLYDRDTNQLVYSYIGNAYPGRQMDGYYSILKDFYQRLAQRLG